MIHRHVRLSSMDDVNYVASHMRENDKEELAALGLSPPVGLTASYMSSIDGTSLTLLNPVSNVPIGMLGVSRSDIRGFGLIWMLGTDGIEETPITFLRGSKTVLNYLYRCTGYDAFYNYVYHKNELHHKWLKWLNFSFLREVKLGPNKESFYEFVGLRREAI